MDTNAMKITLNFGYMSNSQIYRATRMVAEICEKEVERRRIGWKPYSMLEIQQWIEEQAKRRAQL